MSSSSSEGDIDLPTGSGSGSHSPSKSWSQPPKLALPPQRPTVPPRPKETTPTNSEGLEPTPFDVPYVDPFQKLETEEGENPQQEKEHKQPSPVPAPKPIRSPRIKKPQVTFDAATIAPSVTSEQKGRSLSQPPTPLSKVSTFV